MLSLKEIQKRLKDRNIKAVSDGSGVTRQTITEIRNGGANPLYETIKKLSDYFEEQEK